MKNLKPILLIEDDEVDAMTFKRALKDNDISNEVIHLQNGEEAIAFLKNESGITPCIIILDLNMPRMNGIEFLEIAKADITLRRIPIVVVTTSTEYKDRYESFNYSVAGYMVKPVHYQEFVEMVSTLSNYWKQNELP